MQRNQFYALRFLAGEKHIVCWRYSSTARKPGPLHSPTGSDWIDFTHDVNDGSFTSDGTITLPMTKSYFEQVSSRPNLSSVNVGLDCSVTLPDSPMMFQQTRSSRPVAKLKTVSGLHHPEACSSSSQWIYQIRRDTGISVTDALELAWDRSFWRQIATAGCYG